MYHPYCHRPSALTEYLKQKLHHQRAKRLGRSPSAQVEPNVPLKRNTYPLHLLPVKLGVNICMHESAMNDEDRMNYSLELLWSTLIGHTH